MYTRLYESIRDNKVECVKVILKHTKNLSTLQLESLLVIAAQEGNINILELLDEVTLEYAQTQQIEFWKNRNAPLWKPILVAVACRQATSLYYFLPFMIEGLEQSPEVRALFEVTDATRRIQVLTEWQKRANPIRNVMMDAFKVAIYNRDVYMIKELMDTPEADSTILYGLCVDPEDGFYYYGASEREFYYPLDDEFYNMIVDLIRQGNKKLLKYLFASDTTLLLLLAAKENGLDLLAKSHLEEVDGETLQRIYAIALFRKHFRICEYLLSYFTYWLTNGIEGVFYLAILHYVTRKDLVTVKLIARQYENVNLTFNGLSRAQAFIPITRLGPRTNKKIESMLEYMDVLLHYSPACLDAEYGDIESLIRKQAKIGNERRARLDILCKREWMIDGKDDILPAEMKEYIYDHILFSEISNPSTPFHQIAGIAAGIPRIQKEYHRQHNMPFVGKQEGDIFNWLRVKTRDEICDMVLK